MATYKQKLPRVQHVERDSGLNANSSVRKIKENVTVLKGKIQHGLPVNEDKAAAEKLVEALAVHRLTTPNITDKHYFRPIPQQQIQGVTGPAPYPQNPGW